MRDKRPKGVTVKVLDMQPLIDEILPEVRDKVRADIADVRFAFRLAIGTDPSGQHHLISSEGVGWDLDNEEPVQLDVYETGDGKIHMMPIARANVLLSEASALPATEQDLAEFIREFGSRLEGNFYEWHGILTGARS
jgi:hypothetical protein